MDSLKSLGFKDYYYVDKDKIYNAKKKEYVNDAYKYRYRLTASNGKQRTISMKQIYKELYNEVFVIDEVERLEGEEFRLIDGTQGNYLASNKGRILSYVSNHAVILNPYKTPKGYERIQIYINGIRCNKFVHSLVLSAFAVKHNELDECHHINGNKADNRLENICYISPNEHHKLHQRIKENDNAKSELS